MTDKIIEDAELEAIARIVGKLARDIAIRVSDEGLSDSQVVAGATTAAGAIVAELVARMPGDSLK